MFFFFLRKKETCLARQCSLTISRKRCILRLYASVAMLFIANFILESFSLYVFSFLFSPFFILFAISFFIDFFHGYQIFKSRESVVSIDKDNALCIEGRNIKTRMRYHLWILNSCYVYRSTWPRMQNLKFIFMVLNLIKNNIQ